MNIANLDDGEFPEAGDAYLPNDRLPEALEPILRLIFSDWGAELSASMAHYNSWISDQSHLPAGHLVSSTGERAVHPGLGTIHYDFRGVTMTKECWPQMLWHFNKALQAANSLRGDARDRWQALLARTGGEQVMSLNPARTISRKNHVLVLD